MISGRWRCVEGRRVTRWRCCAVKCASYIVPQAVCSIPQARCSQSGKNLLNCGDLSFNPRGPFILLCVHTLYLCPKVEKKKVFLDKWVCTAASMHTSSTVCKANLQCCTCCCWLVDQGSASKGIGQKQKSLLLSKPGQYDINIVIKFVTIHFSGISLVSKVFL